jgi:hypothetical protein
MTGPTGGLLSAESAAAQTDSVSDARPADSSTSRRQTHDGGHCRSTRPARIGSMLSRPLVAAAVLLVCYLACAGLNNPRGFLGTDTGAKVATLQVMQARDTFVPDAGYWAAANDPQGSLHPLYDTRRVGGHYVAVTTLPMIMLARPLWDMGGMRLALLLPMLGGVAVAAAGAALAKRLGSRSPATVFWVIGLGSPVFLYSLDLWEHTLGLACMAWAIVLLYDTWSRRAGWRAAAAAGVLFGLGATMRTEALLYGAIATAVTVVAVVVADRALRRAVPIAAGALAGIVPVLVADDRFEHAILGGSLRTARAAGTAGAAGSQLATRLGEALRTTVGLNYASLWVEALAGCCITIALIAAAVMLARGRGRPRHQVELLTAVAVLLVVRLHSGLSFISGFIPALPITAFGIVLAWRDARTRIVAVIALAALPGVWLLQYTGGAGPQWGGRYVLCSGFLLAVVGLVAVETLPRWSRVCVIALCVAITVAGVRYLEIRSNQGARAAETIAALPDDVVVSRFAYLFREVGSAYTPERHWLTALDARDLRRAATIARVHGATTVAVISEPGPAAHLDGYRLTGRRSLPFFSETLVIDSYLRQA